VDDEDGRDYEYLLDDETLLSAQSGGGGGGSPYTVYKSKSYFHFDVDEQDGFFLVGRGRFSVGPVKFVLEEPKSKDLAVHRQGLAKVPVIEVEVTARWNDKDLLKTTKVCSLTRRRNGTSDDLVGDDREAYYHSGKDYGVGIYSPQPDYPDQYRHLSFETIVRFPPSALPRLKNLFLRGPSFTPLDVALSPMQFEHVHFKTENGAVSVPPSYSLAANNLTVHTSNGRVEGTFNVSKALHLESSNGAVEARVNLIKPQDAQTHHISAVGMTSNGNVKLEYLEHPYGVVLESSAQTSNGNAYVDHQPAYEGSFVVSCPLMSRLMIPLTPLTPHASSSTATDLVGTGSDLRGRESKRSIREGSPAGHRHHHRRPHYRSRAQGRNDRLAARVAGDAGEVQSPDQPGRRHPQVLVAAGRSSSCRVLEGRDSCSSGGSQCSGVHIRVRCCSYSLGSRPSGPCSILYLQRVAESI